MSELIFNRLLALQHQTNHTVYDSKWNELRTWIKNPNTIDTMAGTAEVKYFDVNSSFTAQVGAANPNTLYIMPLNQGIAQGTGVSERIGNHVQAAGLRIGILGIADTEVPLITRILVLRTPAIGTGTEHPVPISEVVYTPPGADDKALVLAPRRLETQKSSGQVLYDNTVVFSEKDSDGLVRMIKTEIELDARVLFRSATAGSITTNALTLYLVSVGPTHAKATFSILSRFTYTDS